jgi:branched-chain amino acid transport system permease protein
VIFIGRLETLEPRPARWTPIHQDETAAEVMGIDVVRIKLLAFGLGAMIAGIAGALYAHQATYGLHDFQHHAGGGDPDLPWWSAAAARTGGPLQVAPPFSS